MKPPPPLLIVIMCVHNGAETVSAAIDSVLHQLTDGMMLEIIDDGSTDTTPIIVERFRSAHPNLISIRTIPHSGKAAALEIALKGSCASYYMFCDADDIMLPNAIETLLKAARESHSADIIMAPYIQFDGNGTVIVRPRSTINSLDDMPIDTVHFALWNKLFTYSAISHVEPFTGIDRWEDLGIIAKIMKLGTTRVKVIDTPVYGYMIRPGKPSLSRSDKDTVLADRLAMARNIIDLFGEKYTRANPMFTDHLKFCAKIKMAQKPHRNLRAWHSTFPEVNRRIMRLKHIPLRFRMLFTLAHWVMSITPPWLTAKQ